jgi:predicted cytidylate kinase
MIGVTLTIGGPPGSGKSTLARSLARILGREYVSAGEIFRAEAARRKLSLSEFGALAEKDERIDLALDERMIAAAGPREVLEGRIIGELLARRRIPVFRILITAEERIRAQRVQGRDGGSYEEVLSAMRIREQTEARRYLRYYGIDLSRMGFELVIDSTRLDPGQVVLRTLEGIPEEWKERA